MTILSARYWLPFSILERIDVGETCWAMGGYGWLCILSVSSNGSTWVKLSEPTSILASALAFSILERIDVGETHNPWSGTSLNVNFQYPRTDRRG